MGDIFPKDCEQCGKCCRESVCVIGMIITGEDKAPCKLLGYHNKVYLCGAIFTEAIESYFPNFNKSELSKITDYIYRSMGFGVGCDASSEKPKGEVMGKKKKSKLEELEDILETEEDEEIEIKSDGSIKTKTPGKKPVTFRECLGGEYSKVA